jgi:uncharacterized protein (DUF1810 family)
MPGEAAAFDLGRFVTAQAGSYQQALRELRAGCKQTHWMWYVLPQLRGLGRSHAAQHYGITSRAEARAYLEHPLLGARLLECVEAIQGVRDRTAEQILGSIDAMKYRSCVTLFANAADAPAPYDEALAKYFAGRQDPRTLELLHKEQTGFPQ